MNNNVVDRPSARQVGESQLETVRAAFFDINQLGLVLTEAIDRIAGNDLSGNAEVAVLMRLLDGPVRPRELLDLTGLSSAGVTNLVDRLDGHGLITRSHEANDGRAVVVTASTEGRALIETVLATVNTMFDSLLPLRRRILRHLGVPTRPSRPTASRSNEAISRLAKLATDLDVAFANVLHHEDPSPARTAVALAAASCEGGTRHRELLELTTLSSGGVTMLVERLERAGLVTRSEARPPDRRAVMIRLTPAGATMYRCCMDQIMRHVDSIAVALR